MFVIWLWFQKAGIIKLFVDNASFHNSTQINNVQPFLFSVKLLSSPEMGCYSDYERTHVFLTTQMHIWRICHIMEVHQVGWSSGQDSSPKPKGTLSLFGLLLRLWLHLEEWTCPDCELCIGLTSIATWPFPFFKVRAPLHLHLHHMLIPSFLGVVSSSWHSISSL